MPLSAVAKRSLLIESRSTIKTLSVRPGFSRVSKSFSCLCGFGTNQLLPSRDREKDLFRMRQRHMHRLDLNVFGVNKHDDVKINYSGLAFMKFVPLEHLDPKS